PDVDQIYMDALQMMTGSGGWPLNIIALPDGRPFWGATYVKKADWIRVLDQLHQLYQNDPDKVEEYAKNLTEGLNTINLIPAPEADAVKLSLDALASIYNKWSGFFDSRMGGYQRAPKFMMPVNLNFLIHYGTSLRETSILEYVNTTLTKMAYGGIYDHLAGGFSRYSVDPKWHVPHFEKMLYDNAQLISLYSKAFALTGNALYKKVAIETISFVQTDLMDESYAFYSSLDADSYNAEGELEEGAYYVWQKEELQGILGNNFELFKSYYNINTYGLWEKDNYVLIRDETDEVLAQRHGISPDILEQRIKEAKMQLLRVREKRDKPRLDDKILASWNGLMLSGLIDAYRYLKNKSYLELALKNATFIQNHLIKADGSMFHNHKKGKSTINGFLEDYAAVANAFLQLYEVTADEKWLMQSKALLDYCIVNFQDPESQLFFFTSQKDDFMIRRTLETTDNVIPSSNSIMALTLYKMSKLFPDLSYEKIALNMFKSMQETVQESGHNYANWLNLALYFNKPFYEIAIVGEQYEAVLNSLQEKYLPNVIFAASTGDSQLSLFQNRYVEGSTLIYVCQHGSCKLPVSSPEEVLAQIIADSENKN
ncbi:MAG: thioredoxin domain-containing protein, partial [Eudoraea sp.]|nr:thioredoxin domain-containing protein [Eudoraea sp.]